MGMQIKKTFKHVVFIKVQYDDDGQGDKQQKHQT